MATAVSNSVALPPVNGSNGSLIDEQINGLVQGGSWQFGGGPRILTYSFNINFDFDALGRVIPGSGGNWSGQMVDVVNRALAEWSNVANISFQNIASGTYYFESNADLAFTLTGTDLQSDPEAPAVGLGIFPDPTTGALARDAHAAFGITYPKPEGDVFLDNGYPGFSVLYPGGFALQTILHEIGHALGLKHPIDDGGNGRPTFSQLGIADYDAERWTVMTGNTSEITDGYGHVASPMPLDILAIQQIYGANLSYHAGNDTYTLPDHFIVQHGMRWTIWDAGGTDTIAAFVDPTPLNLSSLFGVEIDLRPGEATREIHPGITPGWEMYIAYGANIENATGSFGADKITGNDLNNVLIGNGGFDTLLGGAGADVLDNRRGGGIMDGGTGIDTMLGGIGNDQYFVDDAGDIVTESINGGTDSVASSVSYVLPEAVENLALLGSGNISGTGNSLANRIDGNAGANRLSGVTGLDTLTGGAGNDVYVIGQAASATSMYFRSTAGPVTLYPVDGVVFDAALAGPSATVTALDLPFDEDTLVDFVSLSFADATNGISEVSFRNPFLFPGQSLLAGHYEIRDSNAFSIAYHGQGAFASDPGNAFDILSARYDYTGALPVVLEFSAVFDLLLDTTSGQHLRGTVNINHAGSLATSVIAEAANAGSDLVESAVSYALPADVENLTLTGNSNISGEGNELANVIAGNSGNNRLDGGAGDDQLAGGAGNDALIDIAGNDSLTGDAGNDRLDGGTGQDVLRGGAGFDTLIGGDGFDTADYGGAASGVTVELWRSLASNDGQGGTDTLDSIEILVGSAFGDSLSGDNKNNIFKGGGGYDGLFGGDGIDTVDYSSATNGVTAELWRFQAVNDGQGAADYLSGIENLIGSAFNDTLSGDGADNVFKGGAGFDGLFGGAGVDTADYSDAASGVIAELWRSLASSDGQGAGDYLSSIENLTGSAFNDLFSGDSSDNVFRGGAGNDSFFGGTGFDTADYRDVAAAIAVNLSTNTVNSDGQGGSDFVVDVERIQGSAFGDLIVGNNQPNALIGNDGADVLRGAGGNDTLDGGNGADILSGGAGRDTLSGGNGTDTADYSGVTAAVTVELWRSLASIDGEGGSDVLNGIENVIGSANSDTLSGDANNNVFRGGGAFDGIFGGDGVDAADYGGATSGVTVELWNSRASNDGQGAADFLNSIENVYGSAFNDTLVGDAGNNMFKGGGGFDGIFGGAGIDTVDYSDAASGIAVGLSNVPIPYLTSDGDGAADFLSSIENVTGSAFDDNIFGDDTGNLFKGGAGFDSIFGGLGGDGPPDIDTIDYSDAFSAVRVDLGQQAAIDDGQGGADQLVWIENIIGSAFSDTLVGGAESNVITGGNGSDTISGGEGNDTLIGGNGFDTADYSKMTFGGAVVELWRFAASSDGSGGSDVLTGFENVTGTDFDDILAGDNTDNVFAGRGGNDQLYGGGGVDTADYGVALGSVTVNLAAAFASSDGWGGSDFLNSIENLNGSAFADSLTGNASANRLDGAGGNDTLTGAAGADSFVFRTAGGNDRISDFAKLQGDKIYLQANLNESGIFTGAQALARAFDAGGNATIDIGGANSITLLGVSTATLTAGDFVIF